MKKETEKKLKKKSSPLFEKDGSVILDKDFKEDSFKKKSKEELIKERYKK